MCVRSGSRDCQTASGDEADQGTMGTSVVRIGIAGCGVAARIHLDRLLALDGVAIVGCADPDLSAARALADRAALGARLGGADGPRVRRPSRAAPQVAPDALAIFSPICRTIGWPWMRFRRAAMSSSRSPFDQRARGGRYRQPGPRPQPQGRCRPSISPVLPAWSRPGAGSPPATIGPVRLVTAHSRPALAHHARRRREHLAVRPEAAGGGILADAGDHLIDALLWTTGPGRS